MGQRTGSSMPVEDVRPTGPEGTSEPLDLGRQRRRAIDVQLANPPGYERDDSGGGCGMADGWKLTLCLASPPKRIPTRAERTSYVHKSGLPLSVT